MWADVRSLDGGTWLGAESRAMLSCINCECWASYIPFRVGRVAVAEAEYQMAKYKKRLGPSKLLSFFIRALSSSV